MAHALTSHQIQTVVIVGWRTTATSPSISSPGALPVNATMTTPLLPVQAVLTCVRARGATYE